MIDILNKVLVLRPDGKFSVQLGLTEDERVGIINSRESIHELENNLFLIWSSLNLEPAPTLEEIKAVDITLAKSHAEKRNMDAKINSMKDDMVMKALFMAEQKARPTLEFKDYIKEVHDFEVDKKPADPVPVIDPVVEL